LADAAPGGDQWDVISLPAIAESNDALGRRTGEALWPEWENNDELSRKRRAVGPREWSALYQQRPAPEEGDYFKAEWFRTYTQLPHRDEMRVYGASDYAVTAKGGDYTVHIVVGVDPDGRMHVLDLWRGQTGSDAWIEAWCDLVMLWKPLEWAEEGGQIKAAIGPFLQRRAMERGAAVYRRSFPTKGDKAIRAQSIRGRMAMQGLWLPANEPWVADFIAELLSFPAGKHDDQVDALGLIGQLLDHVSAGSTRPVEKPVSHEPPDIGGTGPGDGQVSEFARAEEDLAWR
jgi:predicted phage terminase large subunit-like protein